MRGADASAGTIKSGGATRRAAKMVVLDVDHPDIEEFVETKAREEDKIRALRDAGFDMDLGGKDITSVQYQNANNSVRVSDEFMRAVEDGTSFGLRARQTGEVIEEVDARELFTKIAKAAWECADPGLQYDDTINDWHTNPETGRITASNPCSEYMSLDNSSCNLASLNLMKFLKDDDTFDAPLFAKAVELIITAMDISICFADFPTESIGETTRNYRQLGIGYANLGALLMAMGLGYDSDGGRAMAAAITSLMTGQSYKRSAELAAVVGPYNGYARNADAHKRVMRKHQAANDAVRTLHTADRDVHALATKAWDQVVKLGEKNGYRNAQASVLAPTGTISFMMDADTTGIEPDFSLVKFKKLVGGGSMQIVNQTVPRALRKLGYQEEQIEAIVEYIAEHGHVIDAPGLKTEHYEVFDCAMGARALAPMGHVRMMAAVPAVHFRRHEQDRATCLRRPRSRRSRTSTCSRGSSVSKRPRSTVTTARSASRCRPARARTRARPPARRRRGGQAERDRQPRGDHERDETRACQQEQQRVGRAHPVYLNAFCSGSTAFDMRSTLSIGMAAPASLVKNPSLSPSATTTRYWQAGTAAWINVSDSWPRRASPPTCTPIIVMPSFFASARRALARSISASAEIPAAPRPFVLPPSTTTSVFAPEAARSPAFAWALAL